MYIGSCQLSWCVIASEALVVVLESTRTDIEKALVEICDVKMKLDFVTIPDNQDWGTADSLRHISDRIKVRWRQSIRGGRRYIMAVCSSDFEPISWLMNVHLVCWN